MLPSSTDARPASVGTDPTGGRPVVPAQGTRRPLGLAEIALTDGFWSTRQRTNAAATLAHCEQWMERLGWVASFDRVADGTIGPDRPGWSFADSEVYKLLEALAWEHGRTGSTGAEDAFVRLGARVAAAQDPDGYLNTCFGHGAQAARYSDLEMGHELYNTGHLLQAAVARVRTVGVDAFVEVARRAADHVCREFGPGGREAICGHPEIEVGLTELGRALDEPRYLAQAALFVERRGRGLLGPVAFGPAYFQDDVPVREATVWRGHAVRALYLAAAAVDVAVDTDDAALLAAVERQWTTTVARRTYLTGGMGSHHQDEGFGEDWVLPPDRAYCETCAGIASNMVSWRLFLATGDVRYADLMERTFYNVVATSPRADGRAFFYANPLHQRTAAHDAVDGEVNPRAEGGQRAPWFDVSCCPTNVARTLATWQSYAAVAEPDGLTLLQYASGTLCVELPGGGALGLDVTTTYPDAGTVNVRVTAAPERAVRLRLRVPDWAHGAVLDEGGHERPVAPGFAEVARRLMVGEELRLELPTAPRLTWPDERIDAVRGCVAVERGPLVLCVESTDLPGVDLDTVRIDPSVAPRAHGDGAVVSGRLVDPAPATGTLPYATAPRHPALHEDVEITLVPYHRWAERGTSTMRVWLPIDR